MLTVTYQYDPVLCVWEYHVNGSPTRQYFSATSLDSFPSGLRQALEFERARALAAPDSKRADIEETYRLIRDWENRGNKVQKVGVRAEPKEKKSRMRKTNYNGGVAPALTLADIGLANGPPQPAGPIVPALTLKDIGLK